MGGLKRRILEQIEEMGPVDVLVGISTKDVERTIIHVMNVASMGIADYFPGYRAALVVCDGFSHDRTRQLAELFELPSQMVKIVTEEEGEVGKGSSIRTIFEIAVHCGASSVILLDGDLLSVRPEWVEHLGKPPLYGMVDLVVPYYVRHKYDGLITNNLAYPLTRALYGLCVRQPIGGEYGLSIELVKKLLSHPLFPHHFGVDIFVTTVAAAEDLAVQETLLGVKIHESIMRYLDPRKLLFPMFNEVVGTMFDLMVHYEGVWRSKALQAGGQRCMARFHGLRPPPTMINLDRVRDLFFQVYSEWEHVIESSLQGNLFPELKDAIEGGEVRMGPDLWSRLVYSLAAAYKRAEDKTSVLNALRALWLGRFVAYAQETKGMDVEETERVLEEQAQVFERNRDYLLSIF